MASQVRHDLQARLDALDRGLPEHTSRLVDLILADAVSREASDVHIEPTSRAVEVRYRLDGVLTAWPRWTAVWPPTWSPGSRCWRNC